MAETDDGYAKQVWCCHELGKIGRIIPQARRAPAARLTSDGGGRLPLLRLKLRR